MIIELWGNCDKTMKTKIDNITLGIAMKLVDKCIGRTNDFILKQIIWLTVEQRFQMCI